MADATNVLTASVLESVLSEWEHAKLAVVYDWHSQSNIVQLPRTPKNVSERYDMTWMGPMSWMRNRAILKEASDRKQSMGMLTRKGSVFGAISPISSRKKVSMVAPAPLVSHSAN